MRVGGGRLLALVGLVVVLTACSVHATVTVRMRADGSGAVAVTAVLDAAAARAATVGGATLTERIRLDDLAGAGWTVTPWRRSRSGAASIRITKPFSRPEQVAGIVAELSGPKGPLRAFAASRDASTFSTTWKAHGAVDLRSIDLGTGNDPDLVAALTGRHVAVAGVEQRIVASALAGLRVRARIELPGGVTKTASAAPGRRAGVAASSDETDLGRIALLAAGIVLGALAVAVLTLGETRARRRRHARSVRSDP